MSKYVIEIEDVPFSKVHFDDYNGAQNINLYRVKDFNALVFDKDGLDKLTPLDKELEEAYQKGLEEGRVRNKNRCVGCKYDNGMMDHSPCDYCCNAYSNEWVAKEKPDEIKVGDEVAVYGIVGNVVVVEVDGDSIDISDLRGWHSWYDRKNIKKTGRHFPQVAELFKAIKGEQRDCSTCKYKNDTEHAKCDSCYVSRGYNKWEPEEVIE